MYICNCSYRISEQAQRQLENSTIFEDLSLGANRPTQLIRRYQELYSQGRVEVIDVLEELGLDEHQRIAVPLDIMQVNFKVEILYTICTIPFYIRCPLWLWNLLYKKSVLTGKKPYLSQSKHLVQHYNLKKVSMHIFAKTVIHTNFHY